MHGADNAGFTLIEFETMIHRGKSIGVPSYLPGLNKINIFMEVMRIPELSFRQKNVAKL